MSNEVKVTVRGIREVNSALKKISDETPKRLKAGLRDIAEHVVESIRTKVPFRTGKAKGSIKPRSSATGAKIAFGGTAAPYYPWLDFGGHVGRMKHTVRDFIPDGRYVYPTIKEEGKYIRESVDDLLRHVIESADLDTKE